MNAQLNTLQAQAQTLSDSVTLPIIGSKKIYLEGSRPDIRVPMREIALTPTPKLFGDERNDPGHGQDPRMLHAVCSSSTTCPPSATGRQ